MLLDEIQRQALYTAATQQADRSYVPYGHAGQGVAALTRDGRVLSAAAVENASYGLSMTAETCLVARAAAHDINDVVATLSVRIEPNGRVHLSTPSGASIERMIERFGPDVAVVVEGITTRSLSTLSPAAASSVRRPTRKPRYTAPSPVDVARRAIDPSDPWSVLRELARSASTRAHAPYSSFYVGAAGLAEDGTVVWGCNVENAELGLTLCSENVLLAELAFATPDTRLAAVVTSCFDIDGKELPGEPCGKCRQLLYEVGGPELMVNGEPGRAPSVLRDLLPRAFDLRWARQNQGSVASVVQPLADDGDFGL